MKNAQSIVPWICLIVILAGGFSCVGGSYLGRDLRLAGPAPSKKASLTESAGRLATGQDPENTDCIFPRPQDSNPGAFCLMTERDEQYDLMRQFIFATLPTMMPADGRITSKFGYRSSPFYRKKLVKHRKKGAKKKALARTRSHLHKGVDIAAVAGAYVRAAGNGTVIAAGYDRGYGKFIDIDHGRDIVSRYAHAKTLLVREGDVVVAGANIATVGASGHATGPHLHFEIRERGQPIDPELFLNIPSSDKVLVSEVSKPSRRHRSRT